MRNEILDKFNDKVVKDAIKLVDTESLAQALAKKIEQEMLNGFDSMLENGFDFEFWLMEELVNKNTAAGKQFNKALENIAKRMAKAI